jgi:glycosyltransferase involved in cell wall biosynthesis
LTGGKDKLVVGIIGQITPRKGQLELIRAFARTVPQLPQAILVVVGAPLFNDDHQYLLELRQEAQRLGINDRVIFTGARADVPAVMQALDLLVMNSRAEPFAVVLLEAVASGTPVLATAVDGVLELIDHKVNGWLIPARDEGKLVEALITLGRDHRLRRSLGEYAQQYTSPRYSAEQYMGLLEDFYFQSATMTKERLERGLPVDRFTAE